MRTIILASLFVSSLAFAQLPGGGPSDAQIEQTVMKTCGVSDHPQAAELRAALPCLNRVGAELRELLAIETRLIAETRPGYLARLKLAELGTLVARYTADEARADAIMLDMKLTPADHTKLLEILAREIGKEKVCRADLMCMQARADADKIAQAAPLLEQLCVLASDRSVTLAEMKDERENPSGYVNAARLNELGGYIQQFDRQTAVLAPQYKAIRGRSFTATDCR